MSEKQAYEAKLQAQLDEWKAEIDRLKAKADGAAADVKLAYHKQIDEISAMQKDAWKRLSELKEVGDDAWQDLRGGIEKAWDSLGQALKAATSRFR